MTPEQITLVQSSFDCLEPDLPALTRRFYRELFARDPALETLFSTDMAEQEASFARKFTEIVRVISDLDEFLAHTRALGARHAGYGVGVAGYQTVGEALLEALAAILGDRFDAETRGAWTLAYSLIAETMLQGAASTRHPI